MSGRQRRSARGHGSGRRAAFAVVKMPFLAILRAFGAEHDGGMRRTARQTRHAGKRKQDARARRAGRSCAAPRIGQEGSTRREKGAPRTRREPGPVERPSPAPRSKKNGGARIHRRERRTSRRGRPAAVRAHRGAAAPRRPRAFIERSQRHRHAPQVTRTSRIAAAPPRARRRPRPRASCRSWRPVHTPHSLGKPVLRNPWPSEHAGGGRREPKAARKAPPGDASGARKGRGRNTQASRHKGRAPLRARRGWQAQRVPTVGRGHRAILCDPRCPTHPSSGGGSGAIRARQSARGDTRRHAAGTLRPTPATARNTQPPGARRGATAACEPRGHAAGRQGR